MRIKIDTAPNVTCAIAALSTLPANAVEVGPFAHPLRPEIAGKLVRYNATGRYAIVSGRTVTNVPQAWARAKVVVS